MNQPWLTFYDKALTHTVIHGVQHGLNVLELLNTQLNQLLNANGKALQCVPHSELPKHITYEQYIFDTGCIPTRTTPFSNGALHDACNALVWMHYPRTKSVLNQIQAHTIAKDGVQPQRGALRDAITLFDESAVVVCTPNNDLAQEQLQQRDWQSLLFHRRHDWHSTIHPHIIGHANLQKLQKPYPGITAQTWFLNNVDGADRQAVDIALSINIAIAYEQNTFLPKAFLPLPLLGIPNWCADNSNVDFYNNTRIFRPNPQQL